MNHRLLNNSWEKSKTLSPSTVCYAPSACKVHLNAIFRHAEIDGERIISNERMNVCAVAL